MEWAIEFHASVTRRAAGREQPRGERSGQKLTHLTQLAGHATGPRWLENFDDAHWNLVLFARKKEVFEAVQFIGRPFHIDHLSSEWTKGYSKKRCDFNFRTTRGDSAESAVGDETAKRPAPSAESAVGDECVVF